jgi:hypothetical protein
MINPLNLKKGKPKSTERCNKDSARFAREQVHPKQEYGGLTNRSIRQHSSRRMEKPDSETLQPD